ncbi:MAG: sulfur oxidation c-type cytochrome SoxA [Acidocella sp. 20-57-95]|nr:MAG: sulfur oxidation c-type cytochrome SoxA [Acidocella sp. 20-57-95]OYV62224.1 MAG: sulfur oxidation c-type cytochrome SoxA [Acidocella sp. 21-58-7]HQT63738.1 sulfur oxidation c-type cytochrome SoxA [Acidocella sp.]HQU03113.1 sulfur oxidation c-type cytochrome SoxA [Acidocella sp.]
MRRLLYAALGLALAVPAWAATRTNPAADLKAFQSYFHKKFPQVAPNDFVNGPYAMDASMRAQWNDIMQFPPFQFSIDNGKALFNAAFPDGHHYADCFANKGIGITQNYPQFDAKTGKIVTLELAINHCRAEHGQPPLDMSAGPMADIEAYMTSTSDGKIINVKIPNDPRALADYAAGEQYFYSRRGQLNFSCASCHVQGAGDHLRSDVLAPALGMTASFPIYRSTWGSTGTLVRRFIECNSQVRAVPSKPDSDAYSNLAYFLAYMNNGLPVAGPGERP